MKPNHILVTVDEPAFSAPCLSQITRFFTPSSCRISLLRVAEPTYTVLATPKPFIDYYSHPGAFEPFQRAEASAHPIYADQIEQSLRATVEQELAPLAHVLQSAGYSVAVVVRFGGAAEEILEFVRTADVDMLCMATHGRTGLSRLVLGSVAEQVLRDAEVPVLLMHPAREAKSQQTVAQELVELEVHA
jgi:nucleotide-binding universal stress UspA family protein